MIGHGHTLAVVGPDPKGLGGISRVTSLWEKAGIFADHRVEYFSTVSDFDRRRFQSLVRSFPRFLAALPRCRAVWVHTSSYRSFYRKAPFLASAQLLGKPTILHIHPTHFLDFLDGLAGARRELVFGLVRRCAAVIVLSESMRSEMERRFPGLPLFVLPNPVDVAGMARTEAVERAPHRLLYLGWDIREKGIFELAEAVGRLSAEYPELQVDLHGTKDRTEFDRYVAEKGLGWWVHAGGWLEDDEKLDLLHRATALVLPSYSEGLPNVVLEAMATRTPLISTRVGGLAELLADDVNATVIPPGDVEGLMEGIRRCLDDPERRARLAEQAYEGACANHSLEQTRLRFAEILETIPGGDRGPTR